MNETGEHNDDDVAADDSPVTRIAVKVLLVQIVTLVLLALLQARYGG